MNVSYISPFLAILLIVCISCKKENDKAENKELAGQIVLFFENPPNNRVIDLYGNGSATSYNKHDLVYYDDQGIMVGVSLEYHSIDTVIINTSRDNVEVTHAYRGIDQLSYIFRNGDSVLYTYDSLKPSASILNRDIPTEEINYDISFREKVLGGDFPSIVKSRTIQFMDLSNLENHVNKSFADGINENNAEMKFLDSLVSTGTIGQEESNYRRLKSKSNLKLLELKSIVGSPSIRVPIKRNLQEMDFQITFENVTERIEPVNIWMDSISNSLYQYSFFHESLKWIIHGYYDKKINRVKNERFIDGEPIAGSNYPDYRIMYDSIKEIDYLNSDVKNELLYKCMQHIIGNFNSKDTYKYMQRFYRDTQNMAWFDDLNKKFNLKIQIDDPNDPNTSFSVQADTVEIILTSVNGKSQTYDELIGNLHGKVVYIDFWASWCGACILEMPGSKELQDEYSDDDFAFIYISHDSKPANWKSSLEKNDLLEYGQHFVINNLYTASQLDNLNIQFLPMYFIYNKEGELVYPDAPNPGNPGTRELLDDLLNKAN